MHTTDRRHRYALVLAVGAATVAVTGVVAAAHPAPAEGAWDFPESEIAHQARQEAEGSHGGQCKVFAQKVVNDVLRKEGVKARIGGYGTPGGAYYGTYERAGGQPIDQLEGRPGDLIQVITPEKKNSDSPPIRDPKDNSVLHTAIIVERTDEPGKYIVRDSNYVASETVGEHAWTPGSWTKRGVEVYIWRFGTVAALENKPIEAQGKVVPAPTLPPLAGQLQPVAMGDPQRVITHAIP